MFQLKIKDLRNVFKRINHDVSNSYTCTFFISDEESPIYFFKGCSSLCEGKFLFSKIKFHSSERKICIDIYQDTFVLTLRIGLWGLCQSTLSDAKLLQRQLYRRTKHAL